MSLLLLEGTALGGGGNRGWGREGTTEDEEAGGRAADASVGGLSPLTTRPGPDRLLIFTPEGRRS